MAVNHGFHATMTARPGKGDELVEFLLNAPSLPSETPADPRRSPAKGTHHGSGTTRPRP
jgi:hypothetical protein